MCYIHLENRLTKEGLTVFAEHRKRKKDETSYKKDAGIHPSIHPLEQTPLLLLGLGGLHSARLQSELLFSAKQRHLFLSRPPLSPGASNNQQPQYISSQRRPAGGSSAEKAFAVTDPACRATELAACQLSKTRV